MLKRKPEAEHRRLPVRKEYGEVIPIRESRHTKEMNEEAYEAFWDKQKKKIEKAVDRFLDSRDVEDLTSMNDILLRYFLKIPRRFRATSIDMENQFEKMRTIKRDVVFKKTTDPLREPSQDQFIRDAGTQLEKEFDRLESSIKQLVDFISLASTTTPDRVFATSVNLDAQYGADLFALDSEFDAAARVLRIEITAYQAKASKNGLPAEKVRELAEKYQSAQNALDRDFEPDTEWIKTKLFKPREKGVELSEFSDEEQLDIGLGDLDRIKKEREDMDPKDKLGEYVVEMKIYLRVRDIADDLGVDCSVKKPLMSIEPTVTHRLLVDTNKGTKELSPEEVRSFR